MATSARSAGPLDRRDLHRGDRRHQQHPPAQPAAGRGQVGILDRHDVSQRADVCLSYTDIVLGIRGRAIGLLARVLYPDLPADPLLEQATD